MAANAFLKPEVIAAQALGLLQREIILPGLVWTDAVGNFSGAKNDTISIRVPAVTAARTRALRLDASDNSREIIMDQLAESKVDVTLDTDVYNAVPITDEELTLDIRDFGAQVLAPQMRAVAEGLEDGLADTMTGSSPETTVTVDPANTFAAFVAARKALNDRNVPKAGRYAVVGSAIEAALLNDEKFNRADQSGSDQALREAQTGRAAGFTIYQSNGLPDDVGFCAHRTAFVMVMRAPVVPAGAGAGTSQSYQGMAMRWLQDYDFTITQDRSLVDCYVGYGVVEDDVDPTSGEDKEFVRAVGLELGS